MKNNATPDITKRTVCSTNPLVGRKILTTQNRKSLNIEYIATTVAKLPVIAKNNGHSKYRIACIPASFISAGQVWYGPHNLGYRFHISENVAPSNGPTNMAIIIENISTKSVR